MDESTFLKTEIDKLWSEVKELRKGQNDTSQSIAEIKTDIKYIRKEFEEFSKALTELRNVPSQRWNTVITSIITALTGGIVGAILMILIKKG